VPIESYELRECHSFPAPFTSPSFGTQSANGSRFVDTLLTIVETCRQQSQNAFAFVTTALEAHFAQQPAPSFTRAWTVTSVP